MATERRSGRAKRKARADEASLEDARRTLESDFDFPKIERPVIEQMFAAAREAGKRVKTRLHHAADVARDPARFFVVIQESGVLDRSPILIDTIMPEVIEIKARGVKILNGFSVAGVKWFTADDATEDWLRSEFSGRRLKASGVIE